MASYRPGADASPSSHTPIIAKLVAVVALQEMERLRLADGRVDHLAEVGANCRRQLLAFANEYHEVSPSSISRRSNTAYPCRCYYSS